MEKIPTAEEYLKESDTYDKDYPTISLYDAEQCMIEFAKLHVEAALKEASENAKAHIDHNGEWVSTNVKSRVNKESILNSYPLENIK